MSRTPPTTSAAATSASWRMRIGVGPAWSCTPWKVTRDQAMATMPSTTPMDEALLLEDRPLLDVELEVGAERPRDAGLGPEIADPLELVAEPEPVLVARVVGVLEGNLARHHSRADHGGLKARALLVGEDGHGHGVAGAAAGVVQRADRLERAEHAELAVVLAAGGHGIGVRAHHDGRQRQGAGPLAEDVAHLVDAQGQAGLAHPPTRRSRPRRSSSLSARRVSPPRAVSPIRPSRSMLSASSIPVYPHRAPRSRASPAGGGGRRGHCCCCCCCWLISSSTIRMFRSRRRSGISWNTGRSMCSRSSRSVAMAFCSECAREHRGGERLLGVAAVDALVRRHVVVVAAVGHHHVVLVELAVVGGVERDPPRRRRVELDPRVALGRLGAVGLDVEVAAHVAAGNPPHAEQPQHQVGEVLAHARPEPEEVVGGRVVAGDVLPVLEALADEPAERGDLLAERRPGRDGGLRGERAQVGAVAHRPAELEEVEQGIRRGRRAAWRRRRRRSGTAGIPVDTSARASPRCGRGTARW